MDRYDTETEIDDDLYLIENTGEDAGYQLLNQNSEPFPEPESSSIYQSSDSSSGDDCLICIHKIKTGEPYAQIVNDTKQRYHPECLGTWFAETDIGIITPKPVTEYVICQMNPDDKTITIPVEPLHPPAVQPQQAHQQITNTESEDYQYAEKICFFYVVIVGILFVAYKIIQRNYH